MLDKNGIAKRIAKGSKGRIFTLTWNWNTNLVANFVRKGYKLEFQSGKWRVGNGPSLLKGEGGCRSQLMTGKQTLPLFQEPRFSTL